MRRGAHGTSVECLKACQECDDRWHRDTAPFRRSQNESIARFAQRWKAKALSAIGYSPRAVMPRTETIAQFAARHRARMLSQVAQRCSPDARQQV
jgi:hypothetical protein